MAEEEDIEEEKGKSGNGMIMAMLGVNMLAIIIVALVATGIIKTGGSNTAPPPPGAMDGTGAPVQAAPTTAVGPPWSIEDMIVNLRVPDGNKYLKVSFEFELTSEEMVTIADTRKATVKARINNFLSDLTVDETVGSQNRQFIAERLLARLNNDMERYANGPMFRSVVFPVFLVQ
ncbi:MAG: hypothetical protein CMH55_01555 [Myxococcales bacterium]|nr:hypothetical protein [Myxococcales bacterium]|tara:strand:- start:863 stop:1387 length:525 start_codon:yes stop_codon:yes gene_type:complete